MSEEKQDNWFEKIGKLTLEYYRLVAYFMNKPLEDRYALFTKEIPSIAQDEIEILKLYEKDLRIERLTIYKLEYKFMSSIWKLN